MCPFCPRFPPLQLFIRFAQPAARKGVVDWRRTSPSAMATPQQQPSMPGLSGQGPLQAFGNMQRALRDADKRLDALGQSQLQVATAVDGKLNKTVRRMEEDNAALRKETHDLLAELEQLTLQMYEVTRTRTRT